MRTSELIAANNEKRAILTKHNEAYYGKLLLYIRTKILLSEKQSEEILMEMLDHLLDGQQEGKKAESIFGEDPIVYADAIISELPSEDKRHIAGFLIEITCLIVGYALLIRGVALLVLGLFGEVSEQIPIITALFNSILIGLFVIVSVWFILRRLQASIVHQRSYVKDMLLVGLFITVCMGVLLTIIFLLPNIGLSITVPWWISVALGGIILIVLKWMQKKRNLS